MRILFVLVALFALAGCESMDFTSVSVSSGYSHYYPVHSTHISYTLGYYTGGYYNGYRVYGPVGRRYYHAPRGYRHHRHFARPPVVVHRHVHTSYCEHNYRPRHYTPPRSTPPRHTPPRRTPPRAVPPQVRNDRDRREDRRDHRQDRREDHRDRNDRRRDPKQKRK